MENGYKQNFQPAKSNMFMEPIKEESDYIKKIKENYLFFILISVIFGIFYTVFLYNNVSGITTPFFAITWISCFVVGLNKLEIKISKINYIYMIGIMLFSISTVFTTSGFIIFFNAVSIFLIICIMALGNFYDTRNWQFGRFTIGIFLMFGQALLHIFTPLTHLNDYNKIKNKKESKFKYVIIGLAISVPLVMVILVLLISADSIFFSLFENICIKGNFVDIFGIIFMFCFGSIGFYTVFAGLASKKIKNKAIDIRVGEPVIAITITSILTAIYLVFCLIQIIYLFIGGANALPEGLTYAEYARKGFFQLVVVSIINLGLVLMCIRIFKESKILKVLLLIISACTYIMIASSAYRMILYIGAYQLTFLRILVLWFLMLLVVLMTGVIITIFNDKFNLFRFSLIAVISFYIVFSYAKPDRIVAEYNVRYIERMTYDDVLYMVDNLSYDAVPAISKIDLSRVTLSGYKYNNNTQRLDSIVDNYFRRAQEDYDKRGIRGFNFSSFEADKAADTKFSN